MIASIAELGLDEIDLLGFSIGGFVAQEIALVRPTLVRRLVLAATGPKGAPGMHGWRYDIAAAARGESKPENLLYIMFAHPDTNQAKGLEFLRRFMERHEGRTHQPATPPATPNTTQSSKWGMPDHAALPTDGSVPAPRFPVT